jgi:hypothetical protein
VVASGVSGGGTRNAAHQNDASRTCPRGGMLTSKDRRDPGMHLNDDNCTKRVCEMQALNAILGLCSSPQQDLPRVQYGYVTVPS